MIPLSRKLLIPEYPQEPFTPILQYYSLNISLGFTLSHTPYLVTCFNTIPHTHILLYAFARTPPSQSILRIGLPRVGQDFRLRFTRGGGRIPRGELGFVCEKDFTPIETYTS